MGCFIPNFATLNILRPAILSVRWSIGDSNPYAYNFDTFLIDALTSQKSYFANVYKAILLL